MEINAQLKGLLSYLTKLTHTVDQYRVKFINVGINKVTKNGESVDQIVYDLDITPKDNDIPWLWDFFNCKSKHIVQEGCEMVSIDWSVINMKVNDIYYNGEKTKKYGGNLPISFIQKISDEIQHLGPKEIKGGFWCGGEKKQLILNITYKLSEVYIDDGITTDVSVYCQQALVNGELLENIPQDLAETIVGYMTESDDLRIPLDGIVWDEVTKYMDLEDCDLWTHTYTYIRNIGDIEIDNYDYVNQSTFSSKMCDFMNGDY